MMLINNFVKLFMYVAFFQMFGYVKDAECFIISRPSTMTLVNNQFKNVVIAIHESVPEDTTLIDKLKDTMTKASKYLYTATRERAFFKQIKILLPSTWSDDERYSVPTSENLVFADVIITDPIRGKRSLPQTRSYDGCGKQGVHVLLSKEFLTIPRIEPYYNDPGAFSESVPLVRSRCFCTGRGCICALVAAILCKALLFSMKMALYKSAKYFIHAFAQFRWGVFQEYAEEGESEFYISPTTSRPEAIRCTIMLRGLVQKNDSAHTICYLPIQAQNAHVVASVDNKTGLYEQDCLWRPYPTRQRTKASIMDHQYITDIETFCDDNQTNYMTRHNSEAPSKHNRLCGHRSTWDIITNTDDFRGGNNPPHGRLDSQIEPTFILMRAPSRKRRAAILIDPSSSKEKDIQRAVGHLSYETSIHDIEIVLLKQTDGHISHESLQSVENVETFLNHHSQRNSISFMEHVTKALKMLEEDARANDTHLILVTHQDTSTLNKALAESRQNGLKLSAISNNYSATPGDQGSLHVVGKEAGHTLLDRLRNVIFEETPRKVVITAAKIHLSEMKPVFNSVVVDATLVNHITFLFHYDDDQPDIDIRSPSGVIYGVEDDICTIDSDIRIIKFHLEFTEIGAWTYKVMQTSRRPQNVRVTVISEEEQTQIDPVVLRRSVKVDAEHDNALVLHVDAMQGSIPLIYLKVFARVETPNGDVDNVQLLDNGAGIDISKNDGIYSRTFITPHINGAYHVTFIVSSNSEEDKKDRAYTKKGNTQHLINNIQRQISGGTVYINDTRGTLATNNGMQGRDVIPPSRITDLEAVTYIPYRNTIVLKWTTPGDDFDHGKPSGYHLYTGYDIINVRSFLKYASTGSYDGTGNVTCETILAKSNATETEIFLLDVRVSARTYMFAIHAFDEGGNIGDVSNVATTATGVRS